ncbi:MAG: DUF2442 domain-containing protein [Bacteroidales bacterium]|nr:DUF2442 domain-containing protein [Candidatus Colicola equi]
MIPRIKDIQPLNDYILFVRFDDGREVYYDVKSDISTIPSFANLLTEVNLFKNFQLDPSRTCVTWSEEIDLPSDSIYEYGQVAN